VRVGFFGESYFHVRESIKATFVFEFPMYVMCVSGRLGWVSHVSKGGMCRVLQVAVLSFYSLGVRPPTGAV